MKKKIFGTAVAASMLVGSGLGMAGVVNAAPSNDDSLPYKTVNWLSVAGDENEGDSSKGCNAIQISTKGAWWVIPASCVHGDKLDVSEINNKYTLKLIPTKANGKEIDKSKAAAQDGQAATTNNGDEKPLKVVAVDDTKTAALIHMNTFIDDPTDQPELQRGNNFGTYGSWAIPSDGNGLDTVGQQVAWANLKELKAGTKLKVISFGDAENPKRAKKEAHVVNATLIDAEPLFVAPFFGEEGDGGKVTVSLLLDEYPSDKEDGKWKNPINAPVDNGAAVVTEDGKFVGFYTRGANAVTGQGGRLVAYNLATPYSVFASWANETMKNYVPACKADKCQYEATKNEPEKAFYEDQTDTHTFANPVEILPHDKNITGNTENRFKGALEDGSDKLSYMYMPVAENGDTTLKWVVGDKDKRLPILQKEGNIAKLNGWVSLSKDYGSSFLNTGVWLGSANPESNVVTGGNTKATQNLFAFGTDEENTTSGGGEGIKTKIPTVGSGGTTSRDLPTPTITTLRNPANDNAISNVIENETAKALLYLNGGYTISGKWITGYVEAYGLDKEKDYTVVLKDVEGDKVESTTPLKTDKNGIGKVMVKNPTSWNGAVKKLLIVEGTDNAVLSKNVLIQAENSDVTAATPGGATGANGTGANNSDDRNRNNGVVDNGRSGDDRDNRGRDNDRNSDRNNDRGRDNGSGVNGQNGNNSNVNPTTVTTRPGDVVDGPRIVASTGENGQIVISAGANANHPITPNSKVSIADVKGKRVITVDGVPVTNVDGRALVWEGGDTIKVIPADGSPAFNLALEPEDKISNPGNTPDRANRANPDVNGSTGTPPVANNSDEPRILDVVPGPDGRYRLSAPPVVNKQGQLETANGELIRDRSTGRVLTKEDQDKVLVQTPEGTYKPVGELAHTGVVSTPMILGVALSTIFAGVAFMLAALRNRKPARVKKH